MNYQEFIKPELLVLVPVLYFIGVAIKKSTIKDAFIPFILGVTSVLLSGIYLLATTEINGTQDVATALFTAITQGVLIAATSVYTNQIIKQAGKAKEEEKED